MSVSYTHLDVYKRQRVNSFSVRFVFTDLLAQIAQLVEQRTENPRVAGSIPALGIVTSLVFN